MIISPVNEFDAVVDAPPSKAHTLRGLFIASLAEGKSVLRNSLFAEDQKIAFDALKSFGVDIEYREGNFFIDGSGGKLKAPENDVFVGNSGVTARFILPIALLAKGKSIITGSERMSKRPLEPLAIALRKLGAEIETTANSVPVRVYGGKFYGGATEVDGKDSSQFLSSILISAPYSESGVEVKVKNGLRSEPYVNVTVDMMGEFGAKVFRNGNFFSVMNGSYKGRDFLVEGDYSSSSYFFAAAAIKKSKVRVNNLKRDSKQADRVFLEFLEKMGCEVSYGDNFIEVSGGELKAINADMGNCPDVVPSLAVVASVAEGKTRINNISHLAIKESNRIEAVAENLRSFGVRVVYGDDFLEIEGGNLRKGKIRTFNDHRIAMAFSVLGLESGAEIEDVNCVGKSFPDFFERLSGLE